MRLCNVTCSIGFNYIIIVFTELCQITGDRCIVAVVGASAAAAAQAVVVSCECIAAVRIPSRQIVIDVMI